MNLPQEPSVFRVCGQWGTCFPKFAQPKIVGYWSVDGKRTIVYDASRLRYYSPPRIVKVNFDLNRGLQRVQRKPEDLDERLHHLLQWIKSNFSKIEAHPESGRWLRPHFICYRGLLTKIMKTPYDMREGWIICAAKWRGSIYLCAFDTEADKEAKAQETPRQKQMSSWGFKFEQYVLTDTPGGRVDTSQPVNECEEFCCVFESRLNHHNLFYGGEMDGLCSGEHVEEPLPLDKLQFIELKTNRIIENDRQLKTFERHKCLRWWCQSFLVGIENILCGFRDDDGMVRNLENFRTSEIARRGRKYWKAAVAMDFCDGFLRHVASAVKNNCHQTIYKFEKIPNGDIVMTEVSPASSYAFLPDWYTSLPNQ